MEGYDGSVHAPRVLHDAGVNVVLKSDHPVIFGRWLMYEAARAHFYGLDAWTAIASVTRVWAAIRFSMLPLPAIRLMRAYACVCVCAS
jgi:imidazolonepropionase-like amidohydrolase